MGANDSREEQVVLEREDLRRTLRRIAHEIAEKNPGPDGLALVGIHTRGAVLARRLHALVGELTGAEVPLGDIDISLYRDDFAARAPGAQPVVHASHLDFDIGGGHRRPRRRRPLHRPHRPRRHRRPLRLRPPDPDPARGPLRPRPPRASDPARLRRQEPADVGRPAGERPARGDRRGGRGDRQLRGRRARGRGEGRGGAQRGARMKHLLSIGQLDRAEIEGILDRAASFEDIMRRDIKKVPTLRGRTVVNLFYESSTRTSSSFELAAKRLSADLVSVKASGSAVDKGESLKDTVATLSAYDPVGDRRPPPGRRGGPAHRRLDLGRRSSTPATASTSTRARPCSTSTRCGAGSATSTASRSGSSATSSTAGSRARNLMAFRALGAEVTVCGPPTLIPRDIEQLGCDGGAQPRRAAAGRRRLRPAPAARADARGLPALDPRVRHPLPDQLAATSARASSSCTPARSTAASSFSGEVIDSPQSLITEQVASRPGGPHGDPLRADRGRRRPRRRPRRRAADGGDASRRWSSPREAAGAAGAARGRPPRRARRRAGRARPARRARPRPARRHRRPRRPRDPRRRDRRAGPARLGRCPARPRWSRPRACMPSPPSSTRTCTCAPPGARTRRTSRPAPARRRPAATGASWRWRTPSRPSRRRPTSRRCASARPATRRCRSASSPPSRAG